MAGSNIIFQNHYYVPFCRSSVSLGSKLLSSGSFLAGKFFRDINNIVWNSQLLFLKRINGRFLFIQRWNYPPYRNRNLDQLYCSNSIFDRAPICFLWRAIIVA